MSETRAKVRHSMRDSFPQLFGDAWEQAGELFYARYAEIHAEAVKPAEGAADLLAYLAGQGIYLGVVSNKKRRLLACRGRTIGLGEALRAHRRRL